MKKLLLYGLLIIALFFVTNDLYAQIRSVYLTRGNNAHSIHYFAKTTEPADLWLNPYLTAQWAGGFIQFADSIIWYGDLRLDLFRKRMEMIIEQDTFYISEPFIIDLIQMGNSYFIYTTFIENNLKVPAFGADYFELLTKSGPVKLLLRRRLRVDESGIAQSNLLFGMPAEQKKSFAQIKSYYLQKNQERPAIIIKRNKRTIKKLFLDKWLEIKSFASKNKIGYRKAADIAHIVDYYNTLQMNPKTHVSE